MIQELVRTMSTGPPPFSSLYVAAPVGTLIFQFPSSFFLACAILFWIIYSTSFPALTSCEFMFHNKQDVEEGVEGVEGVEETESTHKTKPNPSSSNSRRHAAL